MSNVLAETKIEPAFTPGISEQSPKVAIEKRSSKNLSFAEKLLEQMKRMGCELSPETAKVWEALDAVTLPLDTILDSGKYSNAHHTFAGALDFALGLSPDIPAEITNESTKKQLAKANEGLRPLDDLQRQGIKNVAGKIGEVDAKIKHARTVHELRQLRMEEGRLEIEIYSLAVPVAERRDLPNFDSSIRSLSRMTGLVNLIDSVRDFREDVGKTHKLPKFGGRLSLIGATAGAIVGEMGREFKENWAESRKSQPK